MAKKKPTTKHVRISNEKSEAEIAKVLDGFGYRFTPKQWEAYLRPDQISNLKELYGKRIKIRNW